MISLWPGRDRGTIRITEQCLLHQATAEPMDGFLLDMATIGECGFISGLIGSAVNLPQPTTSLIPLLNRDVVVYSSSRRHPARFLTDRSVDSCRKCSGSERGLRLIGFVLISDDVSSMVVGSCDKGEIL